MAIDYQHALLRQMKQYKRNLSNQVRMLYATVAFWTRELYPDFLCIGVARAATTWIFDRLSQHPDVFLPKGKEVHFFDTFLALY